MMGKKGKYHFNNIYSKLENEICKLGKHLKFKEKRLKSLKMNENKFNY